MRVTLKKIAEISGVSRSTVDKVMNNRVGVSMEVRQRVKTIAGELGYQPNIIGKALAFQKKPLIIAVVMPKNNFTNEAKVGIDKAYEELEDFGVKIEYYITKDFDVAEQISIINYLIDRRVSGIILRPVDNKKLKMVIDKSIENNIPVITFNSDVADSKRMCFVGQDLVKAGRVAGNIMAKLLNGRGKIVIIMGSYDLLALNQRLEGFKSIIEAEHPLIEIIDIIETKEERVLTFQKTLELLKNIKGLNGLYVTGGPLGEIGKAIKLLNRIGEVKIICFDFYKENVELVKEGIVDFAIGQDPVAQGYKSVKILFEYLFNGKRPEIDHIKTAIDVKEKESIDFID